MRFAVSDIYTAIKDSYHDNVFPKGRFYAVLTLNEEERRRLKESTNKIIMPTFFLAAVPVNPEKELAEGEVLIDISVAAKGVGGKRCNGYIKLDKQVVFNVGNYFRV